MMADGLSVVKLIVEGLGETKAKIAGSSRKICSADTFQKFLKRSMYFFPTLVQIMVNDHLCEKRQQSILGECKI